MANRTASIEDLAAQLTQASDKFSSAFENTMDTEDELFDFLRGRERWYVGTQQNVPNRSPAPPPVQQQAPDRQEPEKQRVKCPKPQRVKSKKKVKKGLSTGQKMAIAAGVGLIVTGIAIAMLDSPAPGPADVVGWPIVIQGVNKIVATGGLKILTGGAAKGVGTKAIAGGVGKKILAGGGSSVAKQFAPAAGNKIVPFARNLVGAKPFAKGGYITKPTKALIGEAGPEIVVPMHKFGGIIKDIYKQSSGALLAATAGFLSSQPNNPARGKLMGQINKLKGIFGLSALKIKQGKFGLRAPIAWWNKGRNERVLDENNASWGELLKDDMAQRGQSDASFAAGAKPPLLGRPDQAFNPFRPAEKGGPGSGPTPAVRQAFERPVRGMMNMASSVAGAIGNIKKSIPVPSGLGTDMFGNAIQLNPSAASGWKKAMAHAARDGVNLAGSVTSAFRSNAEQAALVKNEDDPSIINALPVGQSPHQMGWSIDIATNSPANKWMREHGKQYGFNWEGDKDPVHFDFQSNEDRGKFLDGPQSDWKEPLQNKATNMAKKFGGNMLGSSMKTMSNLKLPFVGDPEQVKAPDQVNSPGPSPQKQIMNEQPVIQSTKNGKDVPMPIPILLPMPARVITSPAVGKLDPDIKRHYVVDQFSKATRVEVAYV